MIGYPGELGNGKGNQGVHFVPGCESIWADGSKHVEFKIETSKGNSGSGIYRFWNGKRANLRSELLRGDFRSSGRTTTPGRVSPKSAMTSSAHGNAKTGLKAHAKWRRWLAGPSP